MSRGGAPSAQRRKAHAEQKAAVRNEPSRRSSGRRQRSLRALARHLDEFGPDQSPVVHTFADGWTVRRVERLKDQIREGRLMDHCLARKSQQRALDPNCYSLRDPDNIPHATFGAWAVDTAAEPGFPSLPQFAVDEFVSLGFFVGRWACFIGEGRQKGIIASHHRERLCVFAETPCSSLPPLPEDPLSRFDVLWTSSVGQETDVGAEWVDWIRNQITAELAAVA